MHLSCSSATHYVVRLLHWWWQTRLFFLLKWAPGISKLMLWLVPSVPFSHYQLYCSFIPFNFLMKLNICFQYEWWFETDTDIRYFWTKVFVISRIILEWLIVEMVKVVITITFLRWQRERERASVFSKKTTHDFQAWVHCFFMPPWQWC